LQQLPGNAPGTIGIFLKLGLVVMLLVAGEPCSLAARRVRLFTHLVLGCDHLARYEILADVEVIEQNVKIPNIT